MMRGGAPTVLVGVFDLRFNPNPYTLPMNTHLGTKVPTYVMPRATSAGPLPVPTTPWN